MVHYHLTDKTLTWAQVQLLFCSFTQHLFVYTLIDLIDRIMFYFLTFTPDLSLDK